MKVQAGAFVVPDEQTQDGPGTSAAAVGASDRLAGLEDRRKNAIRKTFTRIHSLALGAGVACFAAVLLAAVTLVFALRATPEDQLVLEKLKAFFPGYRVSLAGAGIGLVYGALVGFAIGYFTAGCRNLALRITLNRARWQADRWRRRHLLDEI